MNPEAERLLRDAANWRMLGLLFECPDPAWRESVASISHEVDDPEIAAAAEYALREASEGLYHSTFGPGGPAPPREVSYTDSVELGYLMSEVAEYYDAFAFRPATFEAPDHVAVEVGFVAYLRMKQAFALTEGDDEGANIAAAAAKRFTGDHLARLGEPLANALEASGIPYLVGAGRALASRTGPCPPRRVLPDGILPVLQESSFSCS